MSSMYKVKYIVYHADHPDEKQSFDMGEMPKSFFESDDEFDTSELNNSISELDFEIECDVHYNLDKEHVTITFECFNYKKL